MAVERDIPCGLISQAHDVVVKVRSSVVEPHTNRGSSTATQHRSFLQTTTMSKKPPTAEDLLGELNTLSGAPTGPPSKSSKASKQASKGAQKEASKGAQKEAPKSAQKVALSDLEELENLAKAKPASRPNTPKLKKEAPTPSSTASARTSEDRAPTVPRKSGDSTRAFHQPITPGSPSDESSEEDEDEEKPTPEPEVEKASGGWWGWGTNVVSAASAAVNAAQKQAEAAVKEIQKNEEAQKWAEQVRGNVQGLRGIGMPSLTHTGWCLPLALFFQTYCWLFRA